MSDTLDFQELQQALLRADSPTDAAECHGTLCGLLCTRPGDLETRWLLHVMPDSPSEANVAACRDALKILYRQTTANLEGMQMQFLPLLPEDDSALEERVVRLRHWCQGFLFGLGVGEVEDIDRLPPDVQEAVGDLAEIARVAISVDEEDDEDEAAWTEILEYVRVAAQLVYDEMQPPAEGQFAAPPQVH